MSLIRTKDYKKILNFIDAREGSGNDIATENGGVITDAGATWDTNMVKLSSASTGTALSSGGWDTPVVGNDWAFMLLINFAVTTAGTLTIGKSTKSGFTIASSGTPSIAMRTDKINPSASVFTNFGDGIGIALNTPTRVLISSSTGVSAELFLSELGKPLASANVADLSNDGNAALRAISPEYGSFTFTGTLDLYGMQMIEFPNGIPSDLVANANKTFEMWENGNKNHYEIFEDGL